MSASEAVDAITKTFWRFGGKDGDMHLFRNEVRRIIRKLDGKTAQCAEKSPRRKN
jgi:hypothetical protein